METQRWRGILRILRRSSLKILRIMAPDGLGADGSLHGWHRQTGDYAGVVTALLDAGARPPKESDVASETVSAVSRAHP